MQYPDDLKTVALEFQDAWLGKNELLLCHRQMNRWIENRSGRPLIERAGASQVLRWWPLTDESAVSCTLPL
jgi:hypothetical protein